MYQPVSEGTRLHDRDQRAPITICPDDVFVHRGRFRKLIIIGLAVMTLLGAAACGSASGSDGSGGGEQGVQEEAQNAQDSAGDDISEANRDDDGQEDRATPWMATTAGMTARKTHGMTTRTTIAAVAMMSETMPAPGMMTRTTAMTMVMTEPAIALDK